MQFITTDGIRSRFAKVHDLSRSAHATTVLLRDHNTGSLHVCKVINKNRLPSAKVAAEFMEDAQSLSLKRPKQVACWQLWSETESEFMLIRDFVEGFDLSKIGGSLDSDGAVKLWLAVCGVVKDLNKAGVSIAVLKPSNVIVTPEREIKLVDVSDLSFATLSACMAPNFLEAAFCAPEVLAGEMHPSDKAVVYSLAALLIALLGFGLPCSSRNVFKLANGVSTVPDGVPEDIRGVVTDALTRDPAKRPAVKRLSECRQGAHVVVPVAAPLIRVNARVLKTQAFKLVRQSDHYSPKMIRIRDPIQRRTVDPTFA